MARTHLTLFHAYRRRHHQPQRVAVLRGERRAVQVGGQQRRVGGEVGDPDVGAVAVVGPDHHVGHRPPGRHRRSTSRGRDAGPAIARHREPGHAVQVGHDLACGSALTSAQVQALRPGRPSVAPQMRRSQVCGSNGAPGRSAAPAACAERTGRAAARRAGRRRRAAPAGGGGSATGGPGRTRHARRCPAASCPADLPLPVLRAAPRASRGPVPRVGAAILPPRLSRPGRGLPGDAAAPGVR